MRQLVRVRLHERRARRRARDVVPAGRERLESIIPAHLTQVESHFTGLLSPTELARFTATLRKLRDHLNPGAAQLTSECGS